MSGFNAKKYAEENPIQTGIGAGFYIVQAENVEMKKSSAGFEMLTFKIRVLASRNGSYINALQWENLTIGHESETIRGYANNKLAEIMLAAGVDSFDTVEELDESLDEREFMMEVRTSKNGRLYSIYRPSIMYPGTPVYEKKEYVPNHEPAQPDSLKYRPPAPDLADYEDDIPF